MKLQLPIADVLDRWSIAMLKNGRAGVQNHEEIWAYQRHCSTDYPNYQKIKEAFNELFRVNGSIWDLESDIRKGKEGELGLEEVGRRALAIRDLNGHRVKIKNEINLYYNEGFEEIKVNHASAGVEGV